MVINSQLFKKWLTENTSNLHNKITIQRSDGFKNDLEILQWETGKFELKTSQSEIMQNV